MVRLTREFKLSQSGECSKAPTFIKDRFRLKNDRREKLGEQNIKIPNLHDFCITKMESKLTQTQT
jgi:hypothetical protein